MTNHASTFRFRLTFHVSAPGFFRFEEQSIPLEVDDGLNFILTARDSDSLATATRFHFEGCGFPDEEIARFVGERLRLRLRVLNSLLGLGISIPATDSRRSTVAEGFKAKVRSQSGVVIVDTIEGLGVLSDDPTHHECIPAGRATVHPGDPSYALKALAVLWPLELQLDERTDDALQILGIATTELSPRAKFLTTYLALERLIERLPRSEAAYKLIEELQARVRDSALDDRDKNSLVSSLGNLREQSFRAALLSLVDRIVPPIVIHEIPARAFLSDCVDVRNQIAHNARLDEGLDLAKLSEGLRHFIMTLIWSMNRIPDVSLQVPASKVQLDSMKIRLV